MSNLVTIDTNNYNAMAKAMGIANEGTSSDGKTNNLPRLKINHSPIMGEAEVNGKNVNVEVVEGGTYKLDVPDENIFYSKSAKIRPFVQRFMYKRFVKNMSAKAGDPMGIYHKTIMADNLNIDLKDNQGGFNCGKPSGWIKDFQALPVATQDLIKQIKRVRVIFGTIELDKPTDEKGNSLDTSAHPFIWEIDNRDAFKTLGIPFAKLAQMKKLPVQHTIALNTEERKLPNGNSFYLPTASLDLINAVTLDDKDQEMFSNFISWIENYNSYIINEWDMKAKDDISKDDMQTVDEFIDIDDEVA
jgi:hypothetical protein|tara:strand:+ start:1829 stop:2734 length:906 start_codon:yes stop_codon:yes gene_type:complete